ncbi:DNA-3-methyladenine glycosylase-like [Apostichopus japonicus]|uniref:DNA-3-methyladenine glycosylase-like n=1 Tax=Stichopus japonicus TaxID=307972 RepID=UPI003AB240B5
MKRKSATEASQLTKKVAKYARKTKTVKKSQAKSPDTLKRKTSPYFLGKKDTRLGSSFFDQDCVKLAKDLLGKVLVRELDGERISGKIVETEAYLGTEDSACHSYQGHKSAKNKAMWMAPGSVYVYLIYGMYHCMNISSKGDGNAVLLRALEPIDGEELMQKFRSKGRKSSKALKDTALCSGPGKLTGALQITKKLFDKESLVTNSSLWIEDAPLLASEDIISCPRIGVDYATKGWKEKPLRHYVLGNRNISKRDKEAEKM